MTKIKIEELTNDSQLPDLVVDFSMLSTFLTCPRKFLYRHIEYLQKDTVAPPLVFGGALHEGLDVFYRALSKGNCPKVKDMQVKFLEYAGDQLPILTTDREFRTLERGCDILKDYHTVYSSVDRRDMRVKYVEIPFYFLLDDKIGFVGRIDCVVEMFGQTYIMDHKTTTSLNARYFDMYRPHHQVAAYLHVYQSITGVKPAGFVINAIASKQFKTKNMSDHFMRSTTTRSKYELEEFEEQIIWLANEISWRKSLMDTVNPEIAFYQNTAACHNYGSACGFIDLCEVPSIMRSAIKKQRYVKNEWKPYDY